MSTGTAALRHSVFMHESADEYVARSVAFLREGLEAGEGCIVANSRDRIAMVRDAFGADADRVTFVDVASTYTRPARALAAYHGAFLDQLRTVPSVRAVAEFQFGPAPGDWDEWLRYEAITNVAYAHLPVWVVCTYDVNRVPDAVLDGVQSTHGEVLADSWVQSDHYEDPRALVRRLTPAPEPLPGLRTCPVGDDLERFREQLARELVAERVPEATALDALVAGTEIAANAIAHGSGIAEVRVGSAHSRFVFEVVDRGRGFDDPVAGYLAPREGSATGLWVARQLTWSLESFQSPRGFTVRMWV